MERMLDMILARRKEMHLGQEEVAEKIGVSRPTYAGFEKGEKELTLSQLRKLSGVLEIQFEQLLFDSPFAKTDLGRFEKYKQIILNCLYFGGDKGDGKITKTKLAKLAYLADFSWFYDHLDAMSGMAYRRDPQGPVPDLYFRAIDDLFEEQSINIETKGLAFMIQLNETPSHALLSDEEFELIKQIAVKWKDKPTKEIVDFTHDQLPWKICQPGEIIPYELITQEDPDHVY